MIADSGIIRAAGRRNGPTRTTPSRIFHMSRIDLAVRHGLASVALGAAFAFAVSTALAADTVAPAAAKPPVQPAAKPAAQPTSKAAPKAADAKPREASLGTGSGPALTRDQLRQCLAEDGRLKKEAVDAVEAQRALERNRAEIDRLGTEVETQKGTIDRSDQAAVDAYNERLRARGKLIEDYRAQVPEFNQRVEKLNASKLAYTKDCTDRKYFEDDYEAIKAGK